MACQIECQENTGCNFWTYATSSGGKGLNCWLKTNGQFKQKKSNRVSGPKYCGKEWKKDEIAGIESLWYARSVSDIILTC